jgi:hypothetical protein
MSVKLPLLRAAIRYSRSALELLTVDDAPDSWAMTQRNLGDALRDWIGGEKGRNIEESILCFRAALDV